MLVGVKEGGLLQDEVKICYQSGVQYFFTEYIYM